MHNDSTFHVPAVNEPTVPPSPSLHRYIARTLRVSARHLPWEIAQRIHAEHQAGETCGAFSSHHGGLLILELDDYSWRADVTADNIAAAQALGWHELRRLLRLAQTYQCEALELAGDNPALPSVLDFVVFPWP
ncbi:hypothetical protein CKY39_07860 [Variovorax boronicumulans]|uniref:Uncharacterized protein n=1 Tax=Variovorax boronicumulans TaxID=436515 RepID=A0A250DFU3_9BURK|nr:hypothetical protein [Variovorax boronicumulans]ATA53134.1 hypothetical protein CKY39_07860 [Variovorax boronicumulans]